MGSQQFCLKRNNHQRNTLTVFQSLLSSAELVDVTLVCEGSKIQAHKMVLSACSPLFKDIFVTNPCKHPVIILKDMKYSELQAIIEFIYKGEIIVSQDKMAALLKSAESLKIEGLTEIASEQHKSKPMEQNSQSDVNTIVSNTSYESPADSQIKRKRRKKEEESFEIVLNNIKQEKNEDGQVTIIDSPQVDESTEKLQIVNEVNNPDMIHKSKSSVNENAEHMMDSLNLVEQRVTIEKKNGDDQVTIIDSPPHSQRTEELQNVNEVNNPDMIHKSKSSVNENVEHVMDSLSFVEQSVEIKREYMGSSNTNETSVSNSEFLIPSHPKNSNDANFSSDMMGFTSKLPDSSVNDDITGMEFHYDASGNEDSDMGAYTNADTNNTNEISVSNSELLIPSNPKNSNDANFSSDVMGFALELSDSTENDDISSTPTQPPSTSSNPHISNFVLFGRIKQVLRKTEEIQSQLSEIAQRQDRMEQVMFQQLTPAETMEIIDVLPRKLVTHEELAEFCEKLHDEAFRKAVVMFFVTRGGKDAGDLTRNSLNKLMTDDLMSIYNIHGRGSKGKRAIKEFPWLVDILCEAVRHWWPKMENAEDCVLQTIGNHLKGATHRLKRNVK